MIIIYSPTNKTKTPNAKNHQRLSAISRKKGQNLTHNQATRINNLKKATIFYSLISLDLEPGLSTVLVGCTQIVFTGTTQLYRNPGFMAITLQTEMTNPTITFCFSQMHLDFGDPSLNLHLHRAIRGRRQRVPPRARAVPNLRIVHTSEAVLVVRPTIRGKELGIARALVGVREADTSVGADITSGAGATVTPLLQIDVVGHFHCRY